LDFAILVGRGGMPDMAVPFLHLLATVAPDSPVPAARAVVAESMLVKHQLLILIRFPETGTQSPLR
jgi:hypothetical protein